MERAAFSLRRVIEAVEPEDFFRTYWERDLLILHRGQPDFYADLLTLDEIDRVVTTLHLDHREINLVDAKRDLSAKDYCYPSGLIDPARLFALFADGATIILPQLQLRVGPLAELCRAMEAEIGARFQTNIYLTPPGDAQGCCSSARAVRARARSSTASCCLRSAGRCMAAPSRWASRR